MLLNPVAALILPDQCIFMGRTPLGPSVNAMYQSVPVRRGKEIIRAGFASTQALKDYKKWAALELCNAKREDTAIKLIRKAFKNKDFIPLEVAIRFYFPEMWANDVDGPIKPTVDAVFKAMRLDDVLVTKIRSVEKLVNADDPHTEIEVYCPSLL